MMGLPGVLYLWNRYNDDKVAVKFVNAVFLANSGVQSSFHGVRFTSFFPRIGESRQKTDFPRK